MHPFYGVHVRDPLSFIGSDGGICVSRGKSEGRVSCFPRCLQGLFLQVMVELSPWGILVGKVYPREVLFWQASMPSSPDGREFWYLAENVRHQEASGVVNSMESEQWQL